MPLPTRRTADGLEPDHQGHESRARDAEPPVAVAAPRAAAADAAPTAPPASAPAPALGPPERWADQLALANLTATRGSKRRRAAGRLYADLSDDAVVALAARCPAQAAADARMPPSVCCATSSICSAAARARRVDPDRPRRDPRLSADRLVRSIRSPACGSRPAFRYSDWNLADAARPRRHQVAVGARPVPALVTARPGVPADGRRSLRRRRSSISTPTSWRPIRSASASTGRCTMDVAHSRGELGDRPRADSHVGRRSTRRRWPRAYESLFDTASSSSATSRTTTRSRATTSSATSSGSILGVVFADLPRRPARGSASAAPGWSRRSGCRCLPDGADYESSVPYHRLVPSCFWRARGWRSVEGTPLSPAYRASLRTMVVVLAAVLRPDGLMPQVGDADDGRLHIFSGYGAGSRRMRGTARPRRRCMFGQPAWLALAGDGGTWEAAWWGSTSARWTPAAPPDPGDGAAVPDAGIAVMRRARTTTCSSPTASSAPTDSATTSTTICWASSFTRTAFR